MIIYLDMKIKQISIIAVLIFAVVSVYILNSFGNSSKRDSDRVISFNNDVESAILGIEGDLPTTSEPIVELRTETLIQGEENAEAAETGQRVTVNYRGWLANNGTVFDDSLDSSSGISFNLQTGSVIQGWVDGVPGMRVGEVRRIFIPSNLAYGEQGTESIPPNSDLIFDVELLEIANSQAPQ